MQHSCIAFENIALTLFNLLLASISIFYVYFFIFQVTQKKFNKFIT